VSSGWPSLKAQVLLRILERQGYREVRRSGSHRRLEAPGKPAVTFAFHDGATVGGSLVRRILVKRVGMSEDDARKVVGSA
jgi:predicted RNA binding protein YcfA (HicA-like mRNA interferase family)